ncbi:Neurobeachin [Holothuria leucospilota]|uniref:Neurobeachin n=1 Tax=Holothuria leucospilota TaxID=206669 RepID=A0A9Q1BKX0_HOLLE|nr:Neurobeachin [Holothuria leucospilota]
MTEEAKSEEKPAEKKDIFAASMPASGNCTTKMKFGVLIGLMEVGEISNNDVVDTVLNLLVGGEFDLESNFTIEDAENILHMLELMDHCTPTLQAEIWSMCAAILRKSLLNLQACTEISLVEKLVSRLKKSDEMLADLLVEVIGVLASYSISVRELKLIFSYLKAENDRWPKYSIKLLKALRMIPKKHGPDVFFSFPGKNGSTIALPPIKTWPYQNGFTFSTWFRVEPLSNIERDKPYLYCFRTGKGVGYSGHFMGSCLVVTSVKIKGKGFQHCVKYDFQPQKWYMVSIVHVYNRWRTSEIKCYVDGQLVSSGEMQWNINTSDPFDKCFLGSAPSADKERTFAGQMSSVYLFSEALTPQQVAGMYLLGPNYKNHFKFPSESDISLPETFKKVLYDGKLTQSIVFLYNPAATESQLCLDSSPKGNFSYFVHSPHALMVQDVRSIVTHSIHSTLHSIGGIHMLFPFFTQLDLPQALEEGSKEEDEANKTNYEIGTLLLGFLCDLLKQSMSTQQQMVHGRGFIMLGYLLQKASTEHITENALETFLDLAKHFNNLPSGVQLLRHLVDHILFNPALWIHTPTKVQISLYTFLANEFVGQASIYTNIRRVSTVLQLMHTLKYYYWVDNPEHRSGIAPRGLGKFVIDEGDRPGNQDLVHLRGLILSITKQLILKEKTSNDEELQIILNYLVTIHEDANLKDVLQLLMSLMAENLNGLAVAFDRKNGIRVIFKLLASSDEMVRALALKVLALFLSRLPSKRKMDLMYGQNLYSLIGERIQLNCNTLTMTMYNCLFEVLTERVTLVVMSTKHPDQDRTYRIMNPGMFHVIARLIRQSAPSLEAMDVRKLFLSDMILLFNNSRENRRILLQCSVWQDWMLGLAYIYPKTDEEKRITEMVYSVLKMLLHHAMKYEWGGWRVWVDTLSIIHSKVSFENHKNEMLRAYNSYQQQQGQQGDGTAPPLTVAGAVAATTEDQSISPLAAMTGGDVEYTVRERKQQEQAAAEDEIPERDLGKQISSEREREVLTLLEDVMDDVVKIVEGRGKTPENVKRMSGDQADAAKENAVAQVPKGTAAESAKNGDPRGQVFSPGPHQAPYRIPEFSWSHMHQRMMSDLLFAIETDIQVWRSQSSKTVIDFVNAVENNIFVQNVTQMVSQIMDNLIYSCGGILPLLSSATSRHEPDVIEPTQNLPLEVGISFINRIMNLVDVLVFASNQNFADLESEKNMTKGGILRQCLRLTCFCAIRNVLECRYRTNPSPTPSRQSFSTGDNKEPVSPTGSIQTLIEATQPSTKNIVENLASPLSPVRDIERLLQDMDVHRLRATIYRDVPRLRPANMHLAYLVEKTLQTEESKQAQFLALAIVYFISVLMVARYRDVLDSESTTSSSRRSSFRQTPLVERNQQPKQKQEEEPENQGTQTDFPSASTSEVTEEEKDVKEAVKEGEDEEATEGDGPKEGEETDETETEETPEKKKTADVEEEKDEGRKDLENEVDTIPEKENAASQQTEERKADEEVEGDSKEDAAGKDDDSEGKGKEEEAAGDTATDEKEDGDEMEKTEDGEEGAKDEGTEKDSKAETEETPDEDTKTPETSESVPEGGAENTPQENGVKEDVQSENKETEESSASGESGLEPQGTASISSIVLEQQPAATWPWTSKEGQGDQASSGTQASADKAPTEQLPQSIYPQAITEKSRPVNLDLTQVEAPNGEGAVAGRTVEEKVTKALETAAPLLREIFMDFAPFLSKTLLGSHGQELLIEGLITMKSSNSVVELVMMLCSQEWQNSIQKHAGLAFIELINEGRLHSHATRDHLLRVANEAEFILSRHRAEDVLKHAEFESMCAQSGLESRDEEKMCDHLITAARRRDHIFASQLLQKILSILTNKHGAWGDVAERPKEYYKVDLWEDNTRRHRRLIRNPHGSSHPEATLKAAIEHGEPDDVVEQAKQALHAQLASRRKLDTPTTEAEEDVLNADDKDSEMESEMEDGSTPVKHEGTVVYSTQASLIAPCVLVKGTLSITASEMYFDVDEEDESFQKIDQKILLYTEGLHGRWHFNDIRAIFSRRYLLQNTAVEIFLANRTSVMFNLPNKATVKKVVYALPRVGVGLKYGIPPSRRVSLASPRQLFKASSMTQAWQRREITNFEYLMYLNTISGRTYNDLNQYPVFPWILTNYESNELDLTLPSNYRDLSKPIGALNPSRKSFFQERYENWEDDKIPPFHYGTHYSTLGFTLAWLLRLEPYTTYFLSLQEGKFDHASRTFHSIASSWKNCQRDTADVKELIPEFFYLPELFTNHNSYKLGVQDDGAKVDDVILPQWAKSAEDFVRINREALESEFVSCQLHQWIDLIFGYKQKGPEAVRATNVFYYLTYEGAVDLEAIDDPVMREAVESQILSFGQTPCQLITDPHPPRSSAMHMTPMMYSDQLQQEVLMVIKFLSNSPVIHVAANTSPMVPSPAVVTVACNQTFAVNKWNNQTAGTPGSPGYSMEAVKNLLIEMDPLILSSSTLHRRQIVESMDSAVKSRPSCYVVTADNRYIMACGFWDKSFRVFTTETCKVTQVVYGHWDTVTCLSRSECPVGGDCYIVSGSRDATLLVWHWSAKVQWVLGDNHVQGEVATPRAILTGHDTEVTCSGVCTELGLVVSGSKGGACLIHTVSGDLLRSLEPPAPCQSPRLAGIAAEQNVIVVVFDKGNICTFSLNGKFRKLSELDFQINAIKLKPEGDYFLAAGENRCVQVWRSHDHELMHTLPVCDASVLALDLAHDKRTILAGMATGSIVAFHVNFVKWHHDYRDTY